MFFQFLCLCFSFSFFHFLSFSIILFFLVGCSKSDFFGLNFVTISLDNSYVKNQFLGPSREVIEKKKTVRPSFPFFLPFFFVFFLVFYFHFLSIFCSFLHFLIL